MLCSQVKGPWIVHGARLSCAAETRDLAKKPRLPRHSTAAEASGMPPRSATYLARANGGGVDCQNGSRNPRPRFGRAPRPISRFPSSNGAGMNRSPLALGDVLIRNPWALHRGSPHRSQAPRVSVSIRSVRGRCADDSREVRCIPPTLWRALPSECRQITGFPRCA